MKKSRSYSINTIKKLYGASGAHCSRCKCKLIYPETSEDKSIQIGEIGHIVALSDDGPRADPSLTPEKSNEYGNLILLCANCHKLVDKQPNSYTVDDLKKMKKEHEEWVSKRLDISISNMGSAELEIAVRNIASRKYFNMENIGNFDLIDIKEKIIKNNLDEDVQALITKGLLGVNEVKLFITEYNKIDPEFIVTLESFFKEKYINLKKTNKNNNEIFFDLWNLINNNNNDFNQQAASLSILCYMFEICEVFEI